jgi:acetyl esterase/lipase
MFVSPGLAPDSLLEQLPPIRVAVGSFDPLLDDSVEFTRRCVCDASILAIHSHGWGVSFFVWL